MTNKKLQQNQPCKGQIQCPFLKTCMPGWLGKEGAEEIVNYDSFVCHKDNTTQCAGHMLVSKNNKAVVLSRMLKLPLSGHDDVFQSEEEFIEHHTR